MKFIKLATSIGLTVGSVLFVSNSAQAADFKSNVTQDNGVKGDVILNSIRQKDKTFSNFSFIDKVEVKHNDEWTQGNTGAASVDSGKDGTLGYTRSENPTTGELANFLGNNNLNYIVDGEDNGTFALNLFFDSLIKDDNSGLDSLFFYERGMNSNLDIQAIDDAGNLLGNVVNLVQGGQKDAGFDIRTQEIGAAQDVGYWGVSLGDLGVDSLSGVRVYAGGSSYNGPDFKVVARKAPEPGTIIGLGSVAALAFFRRRKSNKALSNPSTN